MAAGERPPVRAPLVFVDDLDAPALAPDDEHHLRRVLRVRDGDDVTIADGAGRWRQATFGDRLHVVSPIACEPDADPPITIAFALVKGDRPEYVVQKLTELGVDRILLYHVGFGLKGTQLTRGNYFIEEGPADPDYDKSFLLYDRDGQTLSWYADGNLTEDPIVLFKIRNDLTGDLRSFDIGLV